MVRMYVDGSFDQMSGIYGYGIVAVYPDGTIERYGGAGDNKETAAIRNTAGEMLAAMMAVRCAINAKAEEVTICYDYSGIEFWVTRAWKAKNDFTIKYGEYMRKMADKIAISFAKIPAHSGDLYNEMADAIAKAAVKALKEGGSSNGRKENGAG